MKPLGISILQFIAEYRKRFCDVIDIFQAVMEPDTDKPKKWGEMIEILSEMKEDDLVAFKHKKVNGHRLAVLVELTASGRDKLREG